MTKQLFLFLITSALLINNSHSQETGYFTDARDNYKYKYIRIGEQVWMAENLSHIAEGSYIYTGLGNDDTVQNNEYYGRLYLYETALTACPEGWHLPSDEEWTVLIDFLGGEEIAGGKMKTTGIWDETGLWNAPNLEASNESGFSAVPGGYRTSEGYFSALKHYGIYWSSSKEYGRVWCREFTYQYGYVSRLKKNVSHANSVRCLKDSE